MTTALPVCEVIEQDQTSIDDGLTHLFCLCNEDQALCGADVSDDPVVDSYSEEDECVVCLDLEWKPCRSCGT